MGIEKWLLKNTASLRGKAVAVTGSTGGIGREFCRYIARLGAELILLDRNEARSKNHALELEASFPSVRVSRISLDLEDVASVKAATEELRKRGVDVLIHNAGAYSIPRRRCAVGLDNVFQINFASPYYMTRELLPSLRERGGRVVAVGSIAHNYRRIDEKDPDFSTRGRASLVYGNAKRHLMYAHAELFSREAGADVSIVHPGITFTNITAHYPKVIFALIKHPMKVIFMRPGKAALSILHGLFEPTSRCEWIGPRVFDVWGYPKKKPLATAGEDERRMIFSRAEEIYERMKAI